MVFVGRGGVKQVLRVGSWVEVGLLLQVSAKLPLLPIFHWKMPHSPDTCSKVVIPRQLLQSKFIPIIVNLITGKCLLRVDN